MGWEAIHHYPDELRPRMTSYAWQSLVSMTVALIVWNRSEVILLKSFCADIRQVAYYSVAFSMSDMLLFSATIFGSATSATIFAQYGRDSPDSPRLRLPRFATLRCPRFHCTSSPLLSLLQRCCLYTDTSMRAPPWWPLWLLFCACQKPSPARAEPFGEHERQSYVIMATFVAGLVDISVAWSLIPSFGAVGACIGSGAAQLTASESCGP